MKKGELKQSLGALRYVMNKQGLDVNTIKSLIRNERKLEKAIEELDAEMVFVPSEEAAKYDTALRGHFESLAKKNEADFKAYGKQIKEGQLPVPPQHIDKWNKLVEKAKQDFPEGAKYVDDYQERIGKLLDEEIKIDFDVINLDGFSANEAKSISFSIYEFDQI